MGPLRKRLNQIARAQKARFHMPGHKGTLCDIDLTEIEGTDNLLSPSGILLEAQEQAAEFFNAKHTFFLTCGSTCGNIAMLLSLAPSKIIISRDCHKSVINALALCNHEPFFISPKISGGLLDIIDTGTIEKAFEESRADVLFITRPDYLGRCCDIKAISALCKKKGALLLVDEAHGAHFAMSQRLPESATNYADMIVQSAHKTLCAPNQAAYLHIGKNSQLHAPSGEKLKRAINIVHTTSPSYPMLAALDECWRDGQAWEKHLNRIALFRESLAASRILCQVPKSDANICNDESRIIIDCIESFALCGYDVEKLLLDKKIYMEMANERQIVAITSPNDPNVWYTDLAKALQGLKKGNYIPSKIKPFSVQPQRACSIRQAALGKFKAVSLFESVGKIIAQAVGLYPPGVSLVMPGEIMERQMAEYINNQLDLGGAVFGVPVYILEEE